MHALHVVIPHHIRCGGRGHVARILHRLHSHLLLLLRLRVVRDDGVGHLLDADNELQHATLLACVEGVRNVLRCVRGHAVHRLQVRPYRNRLLFDMCLLGKKKSL